MSFLDVLSFSNVQLLHETFLRNEDFCRPRAWHEIAGNGLLPRVLRKPYKEQDERNRSRNQPGEKFSRRGLQQRHMPPLLVLELEVESFLPEQGTLGHVAPSKMKSVFLLRIDRPPRSQRARLDVRVRPRDAPSRAG